MVSSGLEFIVVLGNHLVRLFASCGSLLEANLVFCKITKPSAHTWHAIISAHAKLGSNEKALELFNKMQFSGVKPSKLIFLSILKACGSVAASREGELIHGQIISNGLDSDLNIGNTLLDMYAKCRNLEEAQRVFDKLSTRDVVSWNAIISGYAQHGHGFVVLELFGQMQEQDIKPNKVTFTCIFNACGTVKAIEEGKLIHEQLVRSGLELDVIITNTLLDMYARCGSLEEACKLFEELPDRDVVSWSAMIGGYVQLGNGFSALYFLNRMQQEGVMPDKVTYLSILKACGMVGSVCQGKLMHEQIIQRRFELDVVMGSTLIDMYAKCGNLEEAHKVFDGLLNRGKVSWNVMISGYAQHGHDLQALKLFERMQLEGLKPDKVTFLCILKACGTLGALEQAKLIHDQIVRTGLESDVLIGGTLIDMYAKSGSLDKAHKLFERLPTQNLHSWNAIIAGYVQQGHGLAALELLEKMRQKGLKPDKVTFSCIFKACATMGAVGEGKLVHNQMIRSQVDLDVVVGNTLIDMYAKFGSLEAARQVFDVLLERNLVSWNSIISGYAQHGLGFPALELFEQLQQEGIMADDVTFMCMLKACSNIGAVEEGKMIHEQIIRHGLEADILMGSTLIDMYGKCGSLNDACNVFHKMPNRNVVSWGALIAGYALQGQCLLAENCLLDMQQEGLKPDGRIYTSLLAACSHAGLVEEGYRFFKSMKEEHGLTPGIEHFNCMIDLLSRVGHLFEAEELLHTMPILPDISGWMSLLTACRTFGSMKLGRHCFDQVVHLDANTAAGYVIMSNIYAEAHMWDNVRKMQNLKQSTGASKEPGRAWIDIGNQKVHEFVVGNKNHAQADKIYEKVEKLKRSMNKEGYAPHLHLVLEPLEDEGKEYTLDVNSVKVKFDFVFPNRHEGTGIPFTIDLTKCANLILFRNEQQKNFKLWKLIHKP